MNVVFIHPGESINMGSYRKRAKIPSDWLNTNGQKADINGGNADIVVFGKPGPYHHDSDHELAQEYKGQGAKVVVDICDDHMNDETLGPIYRDMVNIADLVTCPTPYMQNLIKDEYGKDAIPIDDPYEEEEAEPHPEGKRAFWFGHNSNIPTIAELKEVITGYSLDLMTGPKIVDGFLPWSPEDQTKYLHRSNIVLLPASKPYKTSNRLVDSIRAGCFPVCGKHPSHYEFRQLCWVGNIPTGLQWAKAFQSDLYALCVEAQDYVRDRFSPETIGKKWEQALASI